MCVQKVKITKKRKLLTRSLFFSLRSDDDAPSDDALGVFKGLFLCDVDVLQIGV